MPIARRPEKLFKKDNIIKKHDILVGIGERLMATKTIEKRYIYYYRPKFADKKSSMKKRETKIGNIRHIVTEPKTILSRYIPDVIGWYFEMSTVFECKVARPDFLNDKKKKNKVGVFFYYVAPKGIINPDELRTEGLFEIPDDFADRKIKLNEIRLVKPCVQLLNYDCSLYQEENGYLFYILRH